MAHPVTVMLADEQPLVRAGLHRLLSTVDGITVVGEAETVEDAVAAVQRHRPDVVVLDPYVRRGSGIVAIGEITRSAPDTAILVVSDRDDNSSVRAAMHAGARGYLTTGVEKAGIVHAIRATAAGEMIFGASIASRIPTLLTGSWPADELTPREREILDLLRTGMSNAAIARQLDLAPKTIGNRLTVIFGKLGVANRAEAIARA